MTRPLLIVDAPSLLYRAFYALLNRTGPLVAATGFA
jgi:hypothetical protein